MRKIFQLVKFENILYVCEKSFSCVIPLKSLESKRRYPGKKSEICFIWIVCVSILETTVWGTLIGQFCKENVQNI